MLHLRAIQPIMTAMDTPTKYWTVQRSVQYDATWREGQLIPIHQHQRLWEVSETYPIVSTEPLGHRNIAETYTWGFFYSRGDAETFARALVLKHGGTVVELEGIIRSVNDPNAYNPDDWK